MKIQASHTKTPTTSGLRLMPEIGLVDPADPSLAERLAGKVSDQLEAFASQMRQGLLAASVAIGLDVMGELVDAEVAEVAGPKGRHDKDRTAYRHGSEDGKVTLGGRRIPVCRPRVRTVADDSGAEREVRLESYDTFASVDLLADHMVASMLAGLSGRRYESALEPVGDTVEARASGTSQSSVSRRFITATAERLAEFRSRPLDDQRWLICFVDGFDFAGHTMIGALGVTADGTKVPLGVVEGSTENATVVRHLICGLRDRGLATSEGVLFVLDGGKALKTAVTNVFGDHAVIARCRVHKERINRPSGMDQHPSTSGTLRATRRRWVSRASATRWCRAASSVQPRCSASSRRSWMSSRCAARMSARSGSGTKLSHCSQMLA